MITVLTPTFNRSSTLERLYESLVAMPERNFEWVVVDDGSEDDTSGLVRGFQQAAPFPIRYMWQSNSGKPIAINTGVEVSNGDWVFIVDSDDAVTKDAVGQIEAAIEQDATPEHVGLCFRKELFSGEWVGRKNSLSSAGPIMMTPTEAGHYFKGDLAYVFRRNVLLELPFPRIEGEKFVPELYIWNQVADRGRILFYPGTSIYRCDYLEDGYSRNFRQNLRSNPEGFYLFYASQISRENGFFRKLKSFVRASQCRWYARRRT